MATKYLVASSGTYSWTDSGLWNGGSAPANGDNVIIENSSVDISSGLNQSSVTLGSLTIHKTFTGTIGSTSAYLQIGSLSVVIGQTSSGAVAGGSGRLKLDLGSSASAVYVLGTGSTSSDTGLEPCRLLLNNSSSTVAVVAGTVGIATTLADETSTISSVSVVGGTVNVGSGVTITSASISSGSLSFGSSLTTLTVNGGTARSMAGAYAITTVYCSAGTFAARHKQTGGAASIGTYYGYVNSILDLSENPATSAAPFKITNFYYHPSSQIMLNRTSPDSLSITTFYPVGVSRVAYY